MSRNDDIASCFDRLDTDGNGVLTPDEIASILQERLGFDAEMARHTVDMFDSISTHGRRSSLYAVSQRQRPASSDECKTSFARPRPRPRTSRLILNGEIIIGHQLPIKTVLAPSITTVVTKKRSLQTHNIVILAGADGERHEMILGR